MAGQLSAKIKTDREVAGQLTDRACVEFIFYQKFGSVTVLWPAGLHTVGRLTAFQLAGHHTVGPSAGRPLLGRFLFWPIVDRPPHGPLKLGRPFHGRSVSWPRLGRPVTVIGR
ncbi:hypothetical protein BpHYR1_027502 [Brachionus plicatilis]|uniref:Uncharacterized protein n=1 Tax=Brachionus plicatilis TaxID=10195 RepID=A0A3M7RYQ4_BRAPC|nr:hypothetical protein BpHYR1_027502 [Brachionus plicatilis]